MMHMLQGWLRLFLFHRVIPLQLAVESAGLFDKVVHPWTEFLPAVVEVVIELLLKLKIF